MSRQALELALEALQFALHIGFPESSESQIKKGEKAYQQHRAAITAIKEALAQPEQDTNKNGSPCPEFWDWLPKAYNFEGDGNFTKYNMEVAFLAGKQALQPEQEPVATLDDLEQEIYENTRQFVSHDVMEWMLKRYYTTPPQRTWVGLTDEEIKEGESKEEQGYGFIQGALWAEAKLKDKNEN